MIITKHFELNTEGRDFVIADLHGMLVKLNECMARVNFDKTKDRIFSVGDLIDRGPNSLECLKLIEEPWFHSVRGNHEEFFLGYVLHDRAEVVGYCPPNSWFHNGGNWFLNLQEPISNALVDAVTKLPIIMVVQTKTGRVNIVHAQFPDYTTDVKIDSQNFEKYELEDMLWGRDRVRARNPIDIRDFEIMDTYLSTTFVGHTPLSEIIRIGQYHFIDGGACYEQDFSENKRPLNFIQIS